MKYKTLTLLLLSAVVVGCGQPGPLYLPDKNAPANGVQPAKPEPQKNQ
ncbi:MAG: lipoprotein [Methylococcaceae bacterium]|jgi:predicted small lipoprotein YifL|nr:lipoprotein [Methylicorpusculum sp.]MDO9163013.1 lipoprotein [Methylococcaceae bacterium]MDZ4156033.1 lipoprotein [Methylococcales bacterium]MDP2395148.1 lipoprotein [Methylococcaceae bacterium]MDP3018710.1 lipoprotein [Methylococcaceae bacterium]MDP3388904.1 lipoprotein [Methylococcaceae bacterium]